MPRYSHQLSIAFDVHSDDPDGEDNTEDMICEAISRRLKEAELLEACLPPIETADLAC